jgi:hypothetical protein
VINIISFKVQYWRTDAKTSSFYEHEVLVENIKPPSFLKNGQTILTEVVVHKLYPYSNMTLQVRVINNYYAGPPSQQAFFQTFEGGWHLSLISK